VTRDDRYKIGILIAALCAITWMFMSDARGADGNVRNPSIYPGVSRILNDRIDPDSNGVDRMTTGGGIGGSTLHGSLSRDSSPWAHHQCSGGKLSTAVRQKGEST
jgi:hypothetical protein